MKSTKIRIDKKYIRENVDIKKFMETLSPSFNSSGILVFEKNPKEHYHAYIEVEISLPTIRKKLNEILISSGNEAKSVSQQHHNWEIYKGYLFKYEDTEVLHIGTNVDKKKCQEIYENFTKKVDGEQPNSIIPQLECYLKDKNWDTLKELGILVVNYHKEKKKLMDKHYIGKLITTLYILYGKGLKRFVDTIIIQETPFVEEYFLEEGRVERCKFCNQMPVNSFETGT